MSFLKAAWITGVALFSGTSFLVGRVYFYHQSALAKLETIEELMEKTKQFKDSLKDGDVVSVGQFPMPGTTMLWLTPRNSNQWKQKLENLQKIKHPHIKVESVSELKKWCQIQKSVTRVRIVKKDEVTKIKMSIDSPTEYLNLTDSTDFTDLKQFCSRSITNKEWYGAAFINSSEISTNNKDVTCEHLAKQPYSPNNKNVISPCLRPGILIKDEQIVGYGIE